MKQQIILPLVICFLFFGIVYSMNDTDGICGKGLFPIGSNAKSLVLLNSRVDITLTKRGTLVKRIYEIRNTGKSDTFTFGAIKCYNCVSEPNGDFLTISANGKKVKYREHLSFLRDSGNVVTRRDLSLKDAQRAIASLDGTIETHLWTSFRMSVQQNKTTTIEIEYLEHPVESYFTEAVVGTIYLYTEKFWAGDSVPLVEVRFRTEKNFVPLEYFLPAGGYLEHSIRPDSVTREALLWKFANYRPNKGMYSYTFKLLHPYAVKRDLIAATFSKATGITVK